MSDGKEQPTNNTFQANIDSLFEELRLAIQWERPSILFATHRSAWRLMGARNKLKEQLHMIGCTIIELQASHEEPSIIHQILKLNPDGRMVFFVFNLNHGGEDDLNTYRALNMYRELFIENQVKVVFWMTDAEAANLALNAPDFWAFRHRTIEFRSGRGSPYQSAMYNLPLWYKGQAIDPLVEPGQRIHQLNQSLLQLPAEQESLSIRAQLLYDLGYAYWLTGDAEKSLELLGLGAAITDGNPIPNLHVQYLNGKAIILFQQERYKEAVEILTKLPKMEREDGITRMNLGIMLCGMGKNSEGLAQAERAVKSDPSNPDLWNRLGYVHLAAGNLEKAVAHFEKAIEILPTRPAYTESLATCHHLLGWNDRALSEIGKLRKMEPRVDSLLDVFQAAFEGNPEHALGILNQLIADRKLTSLDARRNTNLAIILDPELETEGG